MYLHIHVYLTFCYKQTHRDPCSQIQIRIYRGLCFYFHANAHIHTVAYVHTHRSMPPPHINSPMIWKACLKSYVYTYCKFRCAHRHVHVRTTCPYMFMNICLYLPTYRLVHMLNTHTIHAPLKLNADK